MTQQRVPDDLLARIAGNLLEQDVVFSSRALAQDLIDEDLTAGKLSVDEAAKSETLDTYQTGVLRVLAELSLQGLVSDLGDFPKTIEIRRGDYAADGDWHELVEDVVALLPPDRKVETATLYEELRDRYADEFSDVGALWHALLELHTLGHLDVSQRPNREQLTGIEFHSRELPEKLVKGLAARKMRIAKEVALMRGWFGAPSVCCNEGFRRYFDAEELPPGTCANDDCRCSACWNKAGLTDAIEPKLYEAFRSDNLRPASATTKGRRRSEEQLDKLVWQLLWHNYAGLVENIIWAVLRGEDHYFSRADRKRKQLWPRLLLSRVRGRKPALRKDELQTSIQRLLANGQVTQVGACRYRLTRYVLQDEARAAAAEAETAAAASA